MLTREGLLMGGENFKNVLVPGNAKESAMFVAVTWNDSELEMPPKENDRLTKDQLELLGAWIDSGIVGATDDLGLKAVDVVHPIRDLHVTLLRLLGLDDNKLTYYHAGRYKQLSQSGGHVIKELIA